MFECDDIPRILDFCNREFVRYRHMIHDLASPCPEWDAAMRRCDYVEGKGFVLRDDGRADPDGDEDRYFVDSLEHVSLLARVRGGNLRLEGQLPSNRSAGLIEWCRQLQPRRVETTHLALKALLTEACGISRWHAAGAEYTATIDGLRGRVGGQVPRLSPEDRPMWRRFVDRHGHERQVNARGGSQAVIRDFEFLCLDLPVDYYVTREGREITGVLTVNPFTDRCDEISTLFVAPEHRRKGLAGSLLTAASRDILARGRQPAYSAAGGPAERPDLFGLLTGIGFELVACPWEA